VAQLCQHQEELERLNAKVLIVTFGTFPAAQEWLAETCSPFQLLLDPERKVYDAYSLDYSLWRSWNLRTMWRYVQLLSTGRQWRGIQGDSGQLGGDFIIGADGIVRLAYRSRDPVDRPPVEQIMTIITELAERNRT
jgi:peroxiredoxin